MVFPGILDEPQALVAVDRMRAIGEHDMQVAGPVGEKVFHRCRAE